MSILSLRFNEKDTMDITLVEQIQTYSKHVGKSKTDVVKEALQEYFKNHDFTQEAQRQSELVAKFEHETDYIKNDI